MRSALTAAALFAVAVVASIAAHADAAFRPAGAVATCTTAPDVTIELHVVGRGVWIAASTGARCFVGRKDAGLDAAGLDAELHALQSSLPVDCKRGIAIAADAGVSYQDVVTAMDALVKNGFLDAGLTTAEHLAIRIDDSAKAEARAPHCTAPSSAAASSASASAPAAPSSRAGAAPSYTPPTRPDLEHAPIAIVTRTDVTVDGKAIGTVASLARGHGPIDAIVVALRAHTAGDRHTVLVQADASTDASIINRVVLSMQKSGYDNILLAVKHP